MNSKNRNTMKKNKLIYARKANPMSKEKKENWNINNFTPFCFIALSRSEPLK